MPRAINTGLSHQQVTRESYKINDYEKLVHNAPIKKPLIAHHRVKNNTLSIYGVTITGLDPRLVSKVSLTIDAPLQKGKKKLSGPQEELCLNIKDGTRAVISLEAVRGSDGIVALKSLKISFSHSITIKNPSSSLQAGQGNALSRAIKDALADVKIGTIELNHHGVISVDGSIKALGVIKKRLPNYVAMVEVPKLDDSFLVRLGLLKSDVPVKNAQDSSAPLGIDIQKILKELGAITEEASYELNILGDSSPMSFFKNNTFFRGPKTPLDIFLKGTLSLSEAGSVSFAIHEEKSAIKCSLGTYVPHLCASIKPQEGTVGALVDLSAHVSGVGKDFRVDMFSRQAVKDVMPRRRVLKSSLEDEPTSENEFNASMGANSVRVDAAGTMQGTIHKALEYAHGSMSLDMEIHDPYSKTLDRGVVLNGHLGASCKVNKFSYKKGFGLYDSNAQADVTLYPSKNTLEKFPEITPVVYQYGLVVGKNGRGRISPPEYGLSRIIRPLRNFEGHQERIDGALTKAPLYPIASVDYFKQVEQITGAKLRHASQVKLLIDGINSMPERLKLINEAKDYICFQTLVFKDDESGWQIARALANAAHRGVKVYGIIDSMGNVESIKDLEGPHPIYEYLKENGIQLKIYNSFVEDGLRAIFSLTKKYPGVFQVDNPKSLKSIAQTLRFFERVIEVAQDKTLVLSNNERSILKHAIHTIFDGKEGVSPEVSVNELKDVLTDKVATLEELLSLTKRIGRTSYRWHEKYLVADHNVAVVGGMNIAKEYLEGGTGKTVTLHGKEQPTWRDTDVLLEGEAASEAYRSFRRNWLHIAEQRLPLGPKIKKINQMVDQGYAASLIQHRPLEDGDHKVVNYLLYNLRTLKPGEKAWFETAYFLPRGVLRALQREMVAASLRGVDVRIITNSEKTSDFGALVEASAFDVRELIQAGARVFFRNDERMVHAKVMVFGEHLTMVGSWNMDNRSATHDSEDVCCIYDQGTNQEMADVLQKDMMDYSDEITLQQMHNRTITEEARSAAMLLAAEMV